MVRAAGKIGQLSSRVYFLTGVTPGGTALLDGPNCYSPQERTADKADDAGRLTFPSKLNFETKPQIAIETLRRTLAAGKVHFDWITADELYGSSGDFLDGVEEMNLRYVVEVRKNTIVFTADPGDLTGAFPGPKSAAEVGLLPLSASPVGGEGGGKPATRGLATAAPAGRRKGPLVHEFAVARGCGPCDTTSRARQSGCCCVVPRRRQDLKYYVSDNAAEETPLARAWPWPARRHGGAWRNAWRSGKMHMGMADYEARSWSSWHHHMAMVAFARCTVTSDQSGSQARRARPDLGSGLARSAFSAFAHPTLSEDEAIKDLIDYYVERNRIAHESHRKSWLAKHKQLARKLLLLELCTLSSS